MDKRNRKREWFYKKDSSPQKGNIPITTGRGWVGEAREYEGDVYVIFPGLSLDDSHPKTSDGRVIL